MNTKLKIILLSDPFSSHTIKWANGLSQKSVDVTIFGLSDYQADQYFENIRIFNVKFPSFIKHKNDGNLLKALYILTIPYLKKILKQSGPVILHAHSASSYGLLGALSSYRPFIISVWGNDVFTFPNTSVIFKKMLEYNFSKTDKIFSTSYIMAEETKRFTDKEIEVISFGIDLNKFKPSFERKLFFENDIVIGTVKSLEHKYGVFDLVRAFKIIKDKFPKLPLKLLLVGRGTIEKQIRQLVSDLGLNESTKITGFIPYTEVANYHNELDIMVNVSTEDSESFGVSVLEASACEKPVIVSNKGGLKEVVENNVTGIFVPANNQHLLAEVLEKLVLNKELRISLGKAGRERVKKYYNWDDSLNKMIKNYELIWNQYFPSL